MIQLNAETLLRRVVEESQEAINPFSTPAQKAEQRAQYIVDALSGKIIKDRIITEEN